MKRITIAINTFLGAVSGNIASQLAPLTEQLSDGVHYIDVELHRPKRTIKQNRLMWLWFGCIARETGATAEDIHDVYCALYLRRQVELQGDKVSVVGNTRSLNTEEFTAFLDAVWQHAMHYLGIRLPMPEDEGFDEFELKYS